MIEVGGRPLVSAMAQMMMSHGLRVCVVSSTQWDEDEVPLFGAINCVNSDPDSGRTGSIKCGLTKTLRRLIDSEVCTCPSNGGRGGHPILLDEASIEAVKHALPDTPLSSLCAPMRFEVEDPHMNLNIDTEADVQMLKSKWPDIESSWKVDAHPEQY